MEKFVIEVETSNTTIVVPLLVLTEHANTYEMHNATCRICVDTNVAYRVAMVNSQAAAQRLKNELATGKSSDVLMRVESQTTEDMFVSPIVHLTSEFVIKQKYTNMLEGEVIVITNAVPKKVLVMIAI